MLKNKNIYINIFIYYLLIFLIESILINFSFKSDNWSVVYINCVFIISIVFIEFFHSLRNITRTKLLFLHPYLLTLIFTFFFSLGGVFILILSKNGKPMIFNGNFAEDILYSNSHWFIKSTGLSCIALISMITGYRSKIGSYVYNTYFYTFKVGILLQKKVSLLKFAILFLLAYFVKFYLYSNGLYGYQQLANEVFINNRLLVFVNLGFLIFIISGIISTREKYKNKSFFSFFYKIILPLEFIFAIAHGARSPIIFFAIGLFLIHLFSNKLVSKSMLILLSITLFYAFTIGSEFKKFVTNLDTKSSDPISAISTFVKNRNKIKKEIVELNEAAVDLSGNKNIALYLTLSRFTYYSETALAIRYKDEVGLQKLDPPFASYTLLAPIFAILPPYFLFNVESPKWGGWFYVTVEGKNKETSSSAFSPVGFLYLLGKSFAVIIGFLLFGIIVKFTCSLLLNNNNSIGSIILFLALLSITYNFDTNVSDVFILFFRYTLFIPLIYLIFIAENKIN